MFSILLLLLPSQSSGQSRCGEFTTNDVEGPFFEVCEFLSNSLKKSCAQPNAPKNYVLAPRNELNDRNQAVLLKGQVKSEM